MDQGVTDDSLRTLGVRAWCASRILGSEAKALAAAEHRAMVAARVRIALRRRGRVSDRLFDQIYAPGIRRLSAVHWTPAIVATTLATRLVTKPNSVVLDVGSGAGKFCVLGALATHAVFVGVEQRSRLVSVSRDLAETLGAERAEFVRGDALQLDWNGFDAFYLFNPFWENVDQEGAIDKTVPLHAALYDDAVYAVQEKLVNCRVGTRVATLNGFGGAMPPGYSLIYRRFVDGSYADIWERQVGDIERTSFLLRDGSVATTPHLG
jgi:hypothetical protein